MAPEERAQLAESLLHSLDPIAPDIDSAWMRESQDRFDAFRRGELEVVDGDQFMRDLKKKTE